MSDAPIVLHGPLMKAMGKHIDVNAVFDGIARWACDMADSDMMIFSVDTAREYNCSKRVVRFVRNIRKQPDEQVHRIPRRVKKELSKIYDPRDMFFDGVSCWI